LRTRLYCNDPILKGLSIQSTAANAGLERVAVDEPDEGRDGDDL